MRISLNEPLPLSLLADPQAGAIILSLFCDARDDAANPDNPRGWWGDAVPPGNRPPWGSRLWTLGPRAKHTPQTLKLAEQYSREALQWLLDDGEAGTISVAASAPTPETLLLTITIDGQRFELEARP